ncbi:hypothetical protein [uncultured Albimonas sp.]|uniref:hypothetical protein n=1 Tax=uncultured Albimonas sp. TaxID=1331701 RepID=UPI0030ECD32A
MALVPLRPSALLLAAVLAAPAGGALLSPDPAQAQAATSRGLPGGSGGVIVRRGGETRPEAARPGAGAGPGAGFSAPGSGRLLDLDRVTPCVQAARPDMSQAILCYRPLLEACPEGPDPDAWRDCRRQAEGEWTELARRFGDQPMTRMLSGAFDPAACETFTAVDQSPEDARQSCRITAKATQALYGHIESLWGGLGRGL